MNIISIYIPTTEQFCFQNYILQKGIIIDEVFYLNEYRLQIELNKFIFDEIEDHEFQYVVKKLGDFLGYSIIWADAHSLFKFLKELKVSFSIILDNDEGMLIELEYLKNTTFESFLAWLAP